MSPILTVSGPAPVLALPLAHTLGLLYFAYRVVATLPLDHLPAVLALSIWWLAAEFAGYVAVLPTLGASAALAPLARWLAPVRAGLYVVPVIGLYTGSLPVVHEPFASLALLIAWGGLWFAHYLATGRTDGAQSLTHDIRAGYAWLRARLPGVVWPPYLHLAALELGLGWLLARWWVSGWRWESVLELGLVALCVPIAVGTARAVELPVWGGGWRWRVPALVAGVILFFAAHQEQLFLAGVANGTTAWEQAAPKVLALAQQRANVSLNVDADLRLLAALNRDPLLGEVRRLATYRAMRDYVPRDSRVAYAIAEPTGRTPAQAFNDLQPLLRSTAPEPDMIDYWLTTLRVAPQIGCYELAANTASDLVRVKAEDLADLRYLWVQEPPIRIEAASVLIRAGRHRAATKLLQDVASDRNTRFLTACSSALQGDYAAAAQQAVDTLPIAESLQKLLATLQERAAWRTALIDRLTPVASQRADVASVLADAYRLSGQPERATTLLAPWFGVLPIRRDVSAAAFAALAASEQPDVQYFSRIAERDAELQAGLPDDSELWFNATLACKKLGLLKEYEKALVRAQRTPPRTENERTRVMRFLLNLGRDHDARQLLPTDPPPELQNDALQFEINARNVKAAKKRIEALTKYPHSLASEIALLDRDFDLVTSVDEVWNSKLGTPSPPTIEALLALNRFADAVAKAETALAKEFIQPQLWDALLDGVAGSPTVKPETAALVQRVATALEGVRLTPRQHTRLALALWRCGATEPARKAALAALAAKPTHPEQRRELALALTALNEPMSALGLIRELQPRLSDRLLMVAVRAQLHDTFSVENDCRTILGQHPNQPYLLWYLADAYARQNKVASANDLYRELGQLWPNNEQVQLRVALLAVNRRDYDVGIAELLRILAAEPQRTDLYPALVEAAAGASSAGFPVGERLEQLKGLLAPVAAQVLADPTPKLPLLTGLVTFYRRVEEPDQYIRLLRHGVQYTPKDRNLKLQLAEALNVNGYNAEAEELYRELIPKP